MNEHTLEHLDMTGLNDTERRAAAVILGRHSISDDTEELVLAGADVVHLGDFDDLHALADDLAAVQGSQWFRVAAIWCDWLGTRQDCADEHADWREPPPWCVCGTSPTLAATSGKAA